MGSVYFRGKSFGNLGTPNTNPYGSTLLAGGSGGGISAYFGDIMVQTQASTKTTGGLTVIRPLLPADITAQYQNGSGGICGIFGCELYGWNSSSTGIALAPPLIGNLTNGAPIPYGYGFPQTLGIDRNSGRNFSLNALFDNDNYFGTTLSTNSPVGSAALIGQVAGIQLVSTNPNVYAIDTTAFPILRIIGIDQMDPANINGTAGGVVYWRVLPEYQQSILGSPYTAQ